jgi:hypothetical protein
MPIYNENVEVTTKRLNLSQLSDGSIFSSDTRNEITIDAAELTFKISDYEYRTSDNNIINIILDATQHNATIDTRGQYTDKTEGRFTISGFVILNITSIEERIIIDINQYDYKYHIT